MAHGQNKLDDLKQRILAQAQSVSPDDYAFTRTIRTDQTSNGKRRRRLRSKMILKPQLKHGHSPPLMWTAFG